MSGKVTKQKRAKRVRAKLGGLPRLSVFRSNRYIYAQIIDDQKGETLAAASSRDPKTETAKEVGELLARLALEKKIARVVFDRGSYKYHGQVRELAEGARNGGLKF